MCWIHVRCIHVVHLDFGSSIWSPNTLGARMLTQWCDFIKDQGHWDVIRLKKCHNTNTEILNNSCCGNTPNLHNHQQNKYITMENACIQKAKVKPSNRCQFIWILQDLLLTRKPPQPPQRITGTFKNYSAKDMMPMNTVSVEEFVTNKLDIRYEIPPRNYSPRSSFQKCTSLTRTWRKHKSLNNSTCFWCTWMTESHTSITHFLPEDYKPKTQWPETLYFPESHTNTQSVCWCVSQRALPVFWK